MPKTVVPQNGILPSTNSSSVDVRRDENGAPRMAHHSLWLVLYFPKLALEVFSYNQSADPAVVVEQLKGQSIIHTASQAAEEIGVAQKMVLSACVALCANLQVFVYDAIKQQQRLEELALWALKFSPKISIQPPQSLLLEVRGSLKLFGGLENLQNNITESLSSQWSHLFIMTVSPTPAASLLLAVGGQSTVVKCVDELRSVLGSLPVGLLPFDKKLKQKFKNIGARELRDIWRLPNDGLARRFGPDVVNYFGRMLGRLPDPQVIYQPLQPFDISYEFSYEVTDTDHIFQVAEKLTRQLVEFLKAHDVCINRCQYVLYAKNHQLTELNVGVRIPSRDFEHLLSLFSECLNRVCLSGPVFRIRLYAEQYIRFETQSADLWFDSSSRCTTNVPERLLEQLQARLGREAISGLRMIDDYRPEYAYQFSEIEVRPYTIPRTSLPLLFQKKRPLWLLKKPQPLTLKQGVVWWNGPINIGVDPERIEAGWWAGDDICRDYYIGIDQHGSRVWLYRDLRNQYLWYLHGLFA